MLMEKSVQQVSMVFSAVDSLSLEIIKTGLKVSLSNKALGIEQNPFFKEDGFIVFADVEPGNYLLQISKQGYQHREIEVEIPIALESPPGHNHINYLPVEYTKDGENELILVVRRVSNQRIEFDKIKNVKTIREGAEVISQGQITSLADEVPNGLEISQAKLQDTLGIASGTIVRILRDKSLKLRPDPYYQYSEDTTLLIGKVTSVLSGEVPLSGVEVEIIGVNGFPVSLQDIQGVEVAFITDGGLKNPLGTKDDLQTKSNKRGDYNFYFSESHVLTRLGAGSPPVGTELTVRASLTGYEPQEKILIIEPRERNTISFGLPRL
ncbi:MAG: hypothetical protein GY797_10220 [Deltaproteobacteria bacterium]|nr:hypothetical protein [Deltaproteobacteria bacterium]